MKTFNVVLTLAAIFAMTASAADDFNTSTATTTTKDDSADDFNTTTATTTTKDDSAVAVAKDEKDSDSDSDSNVERLREIVEALCDAAENTADLVEDFNEEGGRRLSRKLDGHSDSDDEDMKSTWVCDEATDILKELEDYDEADEDGKDEKESDWGNDIQELIEDFFEGASTSFAVASAMAASVTILAF